MFKLKSNGFRTNGWICGCGRLNSSFATHCVCGRPRPKNAK